MRSLMIRLVGLCALALASLPAQADTSAEIDANVKATLAKFEASMVSGDELLDKAKGVLVFPEVFQGGFVVGAEYGEGALLVGGDLKNYYSLTSASVGLQAGAQKKAVMFLFMTDESLREFRSTKGWEAGVDASIALITLGEEKAVNTATQEKPVLGFVIDQKGLMANVTLEGSKITQIDR